MQGSKLSPDLLKRVEETLSADRSITEDNVDYTRSITSCSTGKSLLCDRVIPISQADMKFCRENLRMFKDKQAAQN